MKQYGWKPCPHGNLARSISVHLLCTFCAVLRVTSAALVRNPGLSEKWGWSETAHRWYYPLKALGVFSKKNTRALASSRMLQTCLNNAEVRGMRSRLC